MSSIGLWLPGGSLNRAFARQIESYSCPLWARSGVRRPVSQTRDRFQTRGKHAGRAQARFHKKDG